MPCRQLSFLVVEDHDFQRNILVQLLTSLGAQTVHAAEDGKAALAILRDPDKVVDIVVSDLAMPGMDGMEFVRHLSESGAVVSLILTSAVDSALLGAVANMARAYKVRLLGVIGKPATAGKLAPLIEMHRTANWAPPPSRDALFSSGELTQAWERGEFEPWFLPTVDLASGAVKAMAAVPRWRHPELGMLEPGGFMPSIEAHGMTDDLAWRILQKSAAHCRAWHAAGHELRVCVPLLFRSLTAATLAARVEQTVRSEGIAPSFVVLTLAEEALRTELPQGLENLARMRVAGFGLGIDDFGNGLMAVEQIALVAFTQLKIANSFVSAITDVGGDTAGIAVALEVAAQLKIPAIAAGIGSRRQCDVLREWGCGLGQGPYIAAPMPGDAVCGWLAGAPARARQR